MKYKIIPWRGASGNTYYSIFVKNIFGYKALMGVIENSFSSYEDANKWMENYIDSKKKIISR